MSILVLIAAADLAVENCSRILINSKHVATPSVGELACAAHSACAEAASAAAVPDSMPLLQTMRCGHTRRAWHHQVGVPMLSPAGMEEGPARQSQEGRCDAPPAGAAGSLC